MARSSSSLRPRSVSSPKRSCRRSARANVLCYGILGLLLVPPAAAQLAPTAHSFTAGSELREGEIVGRWVDASGIPITSARVGQEVEFQICTSVEDMNAFQALVEGFARAATNTANDDLDSTAPGVHPDCRGAVDHLSDLFAASGTADPVNALIFSISGPGTGNQGIFAFAFTLTAPGPLQIGLRILVASDRSGPVTPLLDLQPLTIN